MGVYMCIWDAGTGAYMELQESVRRSYLGRLKARKACAETKA